MADVVVITKEDTASATSVEAVRRAAQTLAPRARIVDVRLPITVDDPAAVRGRRVLAVDDGPTLTHGGMPAGAAQLAARDLGATLVDPRPYARGSLREVFASYPRLGPVLPAMGYGKSQIGELEATIDATPCDVVLVGTPLDLRRSLAVRHPVVRARYEAEECGAVTFDDVLGDL
jgi:predicted GTPase